MSTDLLDKIEYPESDGKPMAETPCTCVMWDSIQTLNYWYEDDPNVYVWGNIPLLPPRRSEGSGIARCHGGLRRGQNH